MTSAKLSAMILLTGLIFATEVLATEKKDSLVAKKEAKKEAKYLAELTTESDFDKMERELVESGVILCDNITIVKILDENDEIIYEGRYHAFEAVDPELKRWMKKADLILNFENTSFYKIF